MLTFADLTTNKEVSIEEFRQIERKMHLDHVSKFKTHGTTVEICKATYKGETLYYYPSIFSGLIAKGYELELIKQYKTVVMYHNSNLDDCQYAFSNLKNFNARKIDFEIFCRTDIKSIYILNL